MGPHSRAPSRDGTQRVCWKGGSQIDMFNQIEVFELSAPYEMWCTRHRIIMRIANGGSTVIQRCRTPLNKPTCEGRRLIVTSVVQNPTEMSSHFTFSSPRVASRLSPAFEKSERGDCNEVDSAQGIDERTLAPKERSLQPLAYSQCQPSGGHVSNG